MSALLTAAQFNGITVQQPTGTTGGPTYASDQVRPGLSDGSSVLVFDTKTTALKCLAFMKARQQWMLSVSDDIGIYSISGVKLLIAEQSLLTQRLVASFNPIYKAGKTLFNHRTMSQSLSLDDALQAVGFPKLSSTPFKNNKDLKEATPNPNKIIVDWNFKESVSTYAEGSLLDDPTPIVYDDTP
jgi:hypothetical protein